MHVMHPFVRNLLCPSVVFSCISLPAIALLCCMCPQVRVLYTAPTLIRSLMQFGDHWVTEHDRSSLRILGTVGEPINPHAWEWYHQVGNSISCKPFPAGTKLLAGEQVVCFVGAFCAMFAKVQKMDRTCCLVAVLLSKLPYWLCSPVLPAGGW
jgi:hypothetical protein